MKNYFVPYVVLEFIFVTVFIWKYGFLALILEVILSVIAGLYLVSKFGGVLNLIKEYKTAQKDGIFGNFGLALGSMMLMFPGILSDTIGLFIIIVSLVVNFISKDNPKYTQDYTENNTYSYTYYYTQDGEIKATRSTSSSGFSRGGNSNRTNSNRASSGKNSSQRVVNDDIIDVEIIE
ncbi:MAG: FxsA family protein [Campylobacteraceae bacterium]|nr:FxsA family protein [Campylobacteraceae bacterium]